MGTVTFSAKMSLYPHAVDAVDVVDAVNMGGWTFRYASKNLTYAVRNGDGWWGPLPLGHPHAVDTVDAVGIGAKRSTHTVYSANKGGGDHYL